MLIAAKASRRNFTQNTYIAFFAQKAYCGRMKTRIHGNGRYRPGG